MKTSAIIPVYNGLNHLKISLPYIVKQGFDEIICIDDYSSDESAKFISENYPDIKLIKNHRNLRFPLTVNNGVKNSTGDIIFLINQDAYPKEKIIQKTLKHFSDDRDLFAVTFNEEGRSWADTKFENGFLNFKNGTIDEEIHYSFWPSGGSSAISKDKWIALEGFDPIFTPGYFEDLDLGWRANKKGWKTIWDPKILINHSNPESTFNKTFKSKSLQRIKDRNYLITHWKNIEASQWPEHLVYLLIRIFKHPGYIIPVLQAIIKLCLK